MSGAGTGGTPPPTAEQRAAIEPRDRDVLLEAGAGTGKTRVLVERYCDSVCVDEVETGAILAFTFTERAAAELRTRIRAELMRRAGEALAGGDEPRAAELRRMARETDQAWITTIHGFCRRVLATHPAAAGIDPRFRVLDETESRRLGTRAMQQALDELLRGGDEATARAVASYAFRLSPMVNAAYARLRSMGQAEPALPPVGEPVRSRREGADDPGPLTTAERTEAERARDVLVALLEAFRARYEELKAARSGLDFSDLELRALELLRGSEAVAATWRGRFRHVMVDEFQDTNRVQLDLVEALRGPDTRVFRVGDEHQSIYRFRNADLEVFRAERRRANADPGTLVLPLRGNFRARPAVLGPINVIGDALLPDFEPLTAGREDGESHGPRTELLLTLEEGNGKGARSWKQEGIELHPPPGADKPAVVAEARFLARRLRELVEAGHAARGDIVVLLRAFTNVDAYEEALLRAGLEPYVVGGRGYWSQQQVEDLIRLLGAVANTFDDEVLLGALASPACGVSPDALWLLRQAASDEQRERAWHLWPTIAWRYGGGERPDRHLNEHWLDAVPDDDAARLRSFCATLAELRAAAPVLPLDELVERTMATFGYDLALLARPGGRGRMANVRKLMRLAREYERHDGRDLRGFLVAAIESTRRDEREGMAPVQPEGHDGVRIMTIHAAKGLEFPVVAVPDLGRPLAAGHRRGDIAIARPGEEDDEGSAAEPRFGMRLVFPAADSKALWELDPLLDEERRAEAEEDCRLVYVAATRARERLLLSGCYRPAQLEPLHEPEKRGAAIRPMLRALAECGWSGGEGEVQAPSPAILGGGSAPAPAIRVALNEPTVERADWLAERLDALPRGDGGHEPSGPPPLLAAEPRPVPVGHLSYSALADFERCGYRFYAERVLGLRLGGVVLLADGPEREDAPDAAGDELPEPGDDEAVAGLDPRARRRGLGNAVHAALEWSARRAWRQPPEDVVRGLLAREGLERDPGALARARELVAGWLGSDLRGELGADARAEVPFALAVAGTVVRGRMDLLDPGTATPVVIDFKSDALAGRAPAELGERYEVQRLVYALAAAEASRAGAARAIHLFLEAPDEPVVEELDAARLAAARERLERLVEAIRRGESFVPTDAPYAALCFGCPAAERLCPNAAWRPRRGPAARQGAATA